MKIKEFIIFTNGMGMAFDHKGQQMTGYQGNIHKLDIGYIIDNTEIFKIAKWGEWEHKLTKSEVNYLFCQK